VESKLRVVQLGLGPIGLEAARLVLSRSSLELAGAVDVDPRLAGRDLGELLDLSEPAGVIVQTDLASVLRAVGPDIVLQSTGSRLADVMPQIETVIRAGANLASTTEELLYPHRRHPEEARRIDSLARKGGVSILGTGVNPGFAMDALGLCMSGVCRRVDSITIRRVVDASTRRGPLQRKVGAGMDPGAFRKAAERKELGHVGLLESLDLLAAGLGFELDETQEMLEPVIATEPVRTNHVAVTPGRVAGIHHTARGSFRGRTRIDLDLRMYVGAADPVDEITIQGDPEIRNQVHGGIAGDEATVGMLVNCVRNVVAAPPGFHTMADIPLVSCNG